MTLLFLLALWLPPAPAHYVTDSVGVLPADRAAALEKKLHDFDAETSTQVLVYISGRVPAGTTMEELAAEAIREWGVGQKGRDNGVILFLFTDDRKYRIQVGYGLEGTLTDAKAKEITSTVMKPLLQSGDYAGAVEQGVDAILAVARGTEIPPPAPAPKPRMEVAPELIGLGLVLFLVGLLVATIVYVAYSKRFPKKEYPLPPPPAPGESTGLLKALGTLASSSSASSSDSSSDSWSSNASSSSSSSGFSGGGGSGGGGGASDSW